jgi:hypothetical protein
MADGESVECVAVGKSWVAAATSAYFLRLFTASGLQSFVLSVRIWRFAACLGVAKSTTKSPCALLNQPPSLPVRC